MSVFSDLGRNPSVLSVEDGVARICRGNGSILHLSIAAFPEKLLKHVATNMWQVALQVNVDIILEFLGRYLCQWCVLHVFYHGCHQS